MRFRGRGFGVGCVLVTAVAVAVACGRDLPIGDAPPEAPDGAVVDGGGAALMDAPPAITIDADSEAGPNDPLVFLSDTLFTPNDAGILGADAICQLDYANCKACPPGRTFVAWISDTQKHAIDRVPRRRYATPQASARTGWAFATDGGTTFPAALFVPIGRLSANDGGGAVWTGTDPSGKQVIGHTCEGFLVASASDGHVGAIHATTGEWTQASEPVSLCNVPHPVYCFQVSP